MELIFCGGKNRRFAEIAMSAGFAYGAQLPCTVYAPIYFADNNFHKPNRMAYMDALAFHRPFMASVIDWQTESQYGEVLAWAEEAAQYVNVVMIIPKVHQSVHRIPRQIAGAEVRLGYSVPTAHGGTDLFLSEFVGWPIHLLGGSPGAQMKLAQYLNVQSADGNMHMKMANRGLVWRQGSKSFANRWVSLLESDGSRWSGDGNYEAFRRSCENIHAAWRMDHVVQ